MLQHLPAIVEARRTGALKSDSNLILLRYIQATVCQSLARKDRLLMGHLRSRVRARYRPSIGHIYMQPFCQYFMTLYLGQSPRRSMSRLHQLPRVFQRDHLLARDLGQRHV